MSKIDFIIEKHLKPSKYKKGMRIKLDWRKKGGTGKITGVGSDYIKFKLDDDITPHADTSIIYFNEFEEYNLEVLK